MHEGGRVVHILYVGRDGWMDGRTDGQTEWTDGQMDGTNARVFDLLYLQNIGRHRVGNIEILNRYGIISNFKKPKAGTLLI